MRHSIRTFVASVAIAITPFVVLPASGADTPDPENIAAVDHVVVPSGTYINDMTHTQLYWRVRHAGMAGYAGRMDDLTATLQFDADDPSKSTVEIAVKANSVDTGYEPGERDWDQELAQREDLFNASAHPEMTFKSTEVEMTGPRTATVRGDLTLLGNTRPVMFDATFNGSLAEHFHFKVPMLGFSAKGTFDRTTFGLDYGAGVDVSSVVEIEMEIEFMLKN